jgi:hypothetical protein
MTSRKPFVVTFYKTVSTDFGEDREIKQRTVEVFAPNEQDALKEAQAELCRIESLTDWALHADRYEVLPQGFPS